jgi:predicted secreted protein
MTLIIPNVPVVLPLGDELELLFVVPSLGRCAFIIDPLTGICIAGVQVTDLSIAVTPVDVTDVNSDGYRELLPQAGLRMYDFSISGVLKDGSLRDIANETEGIISMTGYKFEWADGSELDMDFLLADYSESNPMNDAVTFTATISTSGTPLIS